MPHKIKQIIKSAEMFWLSTETVFFPQVLKMSYKQEAN